MKCKKTILIVEDDIVDAMTIRRALVDINVLNSVHVAKNGEDALLWLRENNNALPGLILLDLNMPRMNGIELLQVIKSDPHFSIIPVIVMTTSREDGDKIECFMRGVAGYMIKPVDYEQFVEMLRIIDLYWTTSEHPMEE